MEIAENPGEASIDEPVAMHVGHLFEILANNPTRVIQLDAVLDVLGVFRSEDFGELVFVCVVESTISLKASTIVREL